MRANLPRPKPTPASPELTGEYLRAMQEISARLMDVLPDGQELWATLGQAEALLLEAQMTATPVGEIFPQGGVAAFCQSIIDEYRADRAEDGETPLPASKEKDHRKPKAEHPRGGIGVTRYRRIRIALTVVFALALVTLFAWYTGFLRYLTDGTAFYHEELYNFENTVSDPVGEPVTLTVPLEMKTGLGEYLYTDSGDYSVVLVSMGYRDHMRAVEDAETGKTVYRNMRAWSIGLRYTVKADFFGISYVEPAMTGTARITLADGTVFESAIRPESSGVPGDGYEYIYLTVADLPQKTDVKGATVTITLEPCRRVIWERSGMGRR